MVNRAGDWHRNLLIIEVLYPQECSQDWGVSHPGLDVPFLLVAQVKDEALAHQRRRQE